MAEIRVKSEVLVSLEHRDKDLKKQLMLLKAVARIPRLYTELRMAITRKKAYETSG
jgi:hypothetical protein